MSATPWVALVGDYDATVVAHQAIPTALALATRRRGVTLPHKWVGTETLDEGLSVLGGAAGIWCVPASPYRNTEGAIASIRHARLTGTPFLGTCGGFQHAMLEIAVSLWGISDATHAELHSEGGTPVIVPLVCSLVEKRGGVRLLPGSRLAKAYGSLFTEEGYHCGYGLSPECSDRLRDGRLRATAWDEAGEVRAVELEDHPFFVATLFQPERAALAGRTPPIVAAFVDAVVT